MYIRKKAVELTGEKFWSKKVLSFDDPSVRGEGYSFYIYKFNKETAEYFSSPDTAFFTNYPQYTEKKWTESPIDSSEYEILDFITPSYTNFDDEIIKHQNEIKNILTNEGVYYSYSIGKSYNINFYIIDPINKWIVLIYHNT